MRRAISDAQHGTKERRQQNCSSQIVAKERKMNRRYAIIIVSVLIIAVLCAAFTACSETKGIDLSQLRSEDVGVVAATSEKIEELEGYTVHRYVEGMDLVIFSKVTDSVDGRSTNYVVYSTLKGKIVYSGTDVPYIATSSSGEMFDGLFFVTYFGDGGILDSVDFYSSTGLLEDNVVPDDIIISGSMGYVLNASRISESGIDIGEGKRIVKEGDHYVVRSDNYSIYTPFSESETVSLENYNVYFYADASAFIVFDKGSYTSGKTVSVRDITGSEPSPQTEITLFVLPKDKIAVQTKTSKPFYNEKDYDYYEGMYTYGVKTYVYDIAKGETEEKSDFGYLVSEAYYEKESGVTICLSRKINSDKTAGEEVLQAFDEDLNVALDIQKLLPGADSYVIAGEYVGFASNARVQFYKNGKLIFDEPVAKTDINVSYLAVADLFVETDGSVVYNSDGDKIASLAELGADEFRYLEYSLNYLYYQKTEWDKENSEQITCLYSYDRDTGESQKIAEVVDTEPVCDGCLLVKEDGEYYVYDLVSGSELLEVDPELTDVQVFPYPVCEGRGLVMIRGYRNGEELVTEYILIKRD